VKLVYQVTVEAPAEMKPLFVQLIKDVTEQALAAIVRQMSGAGCRAIVKKH
jgi:hypothetical protein